MQLILTAEDITPHARRASKVKCVPLGVHDITEPASMSTSVTWMNYTEKTLYIVHRDGAVYGIPPIRNRINIASRDYHDALVGVQTHAVTQPARQGSAKMLFRQSRGNYKSFPRTDTWKATEEHIEDNNKPKALSGPANSGVSYIFKDSDIREVEDGLYAESLDVVICTDATTANRIMHPYDEYAKTLRSVGQFTTSRVDPFIMKDNTVNVTYGNHLATPLGFSFRIAIVDAKGKLKPRYMNIAGMIMRIPILTTHISGLEDGVYVASTHRSLLSGLDPMGDNRCDDYPEYIRLDLDDAISKLKFYDNPEEAQQDGLISDNLVKLRTNEANLAKLEVEADRIAVDRDRLQADLDRLQHERDKIAREKKEAVEEAERRKELHQSELEKRETAFQVEKEKREELHRMDIEKREELHRQEIERNQQKMEAEKIQAKHRHRSELTKVILGGLSLIGAAIGLMKAFA